MAEEGCLAATSDPIAEIIGDYRAFAAMQRDRMGLEHLGVVVGEDIDDFSRAHRTALTGQQLQSPYVEPYYVLFEDFTDAASPGVTSRIDWLQPLQFALRNRLPP